MRIASLGPPAGGHSPLLDEPSVEGNQIVARHKGGRLTATVLWPQSPRIEKIGGPGREFEVDGKNYPPNRQMVGPHTPGAWRAEVTGGEGRTRRFLTLLVPADVDAPSEPPATIEESPAGWIVKQGDLAVVLNRPARQINISAPRTIRIELAD